MALPLFTASSAGSPGLWAALGISWWGLAVNALAFLGMAWVLGRYVYPSLLKALQDKADQYEAAGRLKREAAAELEKAEAELKRQTAKARAQAEEIVGSARAQAQALLEAAQEKAAAEAERIVQRGQDQLRADLLAARQELKAETARLAAEAAGALIRQRLNREADLALVGQTLGEERL